MGPGARGRSAQQWRGLFLARAAGRRVRDLDDRDGVPAPARLERHGDPDGSQVRAHVTIGQDRAIAYPNRRFRLGGRDIDLANGNPAYSVEAAEDSERPIGEWNHLDLYVVGNHAIHVVNGVPVMELRDVGELDAAGRRVPLTHGRIQLQSEGAITWFRNIRVEPIRTLPRVVIAR